MTPMMRQYLAVKEEYKDCILLFRLGDFFEMFFEDAKVASEILEITLTARNKKGAGEAVPMCGVPFHAIDGYIAKLIKAGKKVAICDQVSAPTGKGIVQREVVRVITPGTVFEDSLLSAKESNYLVCVEGLELAYADISTGEFRVTKLDSRAEVLAELKRIAPRECIGKDVSVFEGFSGCAVFGVVSGFSSAEEILLEYLVETQKRAPEHLAAAEVYDRSEFMPLDEDLMRNLDLFFNSRDGKKRGSLIGVLDQTVTAGGGRMMRRWLRQPLIVRAAIERRLDLVEVLFRDQQLLMALRKELSGVYDLERLVARLSTGLAGGRDLLALKQTLGLVPVVKNLVAGALPELAEELDPLEEIWRMLEESIAEDAPAVNSQGGVIKRGFDVELDAVFALKVEGRGFIADLQKREIERTGISSLKVKFNRVFGYYIEISKANLASVPADYMRKQTLVNAERFMTPELKEYEEKVLTAEEKVKELEARIFQEVRMKCLAKTREIQRNARVLAELDALSGLAFLALKEDYVRPRMNEEGVLRVKAGRHPVAAQLVKDFVANDCEMSAERRFLLLTGPNMGGKSTYLRQVALMMLMAQIGSFVPAREADLFVADRIFTRVGAADNLAKGQSTFMVEMAEAARILNEATERSLVILDELGRGTSTYDGVSIAYAVSEFLHNEVRAKVLFATHYHELIELADSMPCAVNLSVAVVEGKDGVVFLYQIRSGGVDKSYGIEVAKLAGLPASVIARAGEVLAELGEKHVVQSVMEFVEPVRDHRGLKIVEELRGIDLENMTPMEALLKLQNLKNSNE